MHNAYRISVKRENGGVVSNFLHNELELGDSVKLTSPAGDFFIDVEENTPVVLISAGVGLTPLLSMLESLREHKSSVYWVHATEDSDQHAFKDHVKSIVQFNSNIQSYVWYNKPAKTDRINVDYDYSGLVDLSKIKDVVNRENTKFYFCGPVGFMQFVANQLLEMGVSSNQLHYECFGPHKVV